MKKLAEYNDLTILTTDITALNDKRQTFALSNDSLAKNYTCNRKAVMTWTEKLGINLQINYILYKINTSTIFHQEWRKHDGIVFYVQGGHTIRWHEEYERSVAESQILYLPYGSSYTSELLEKGTEYYEIDFSIFQDGNQVPLLDSIRILTKSQSAKYFNEIKVIYELFIQQKPNYQMAIIAKLFELCLMLCNENLLADKKNEGVERIRRSIAYIQENFDQNFSVEELARLDNVSISTLEKYFIMCLGETPAEYRNRIRIRHAKMLLKGGFSVGETAQRAGFSNRNYFTNVFKRMTGTTPARFQRETQIDI